MKRSWNSAAIVLASSLILGSATALLADDHHGCSYHGVSGQWGFHVDGSLLGDPNNPNYPNDSPATGVGIFNQDSHGNITGSGSLGGGTSPFTFSGTYTVNSDCTGSLNIDVILSGQDIGSFVATTVYVDGARETYWVSEQPDLAFVFVGKKVSSD